MVAGAEGVNLRQGRGGQYRCIGAEACMAPWQDCGAQRIIVDLEIDICEEGEKAF